MLRADFHHHIDADPIDGKFALRHGRVQLVTQPLTWMHIVSFVTRSGGTVDVLRDSFNYMMRIVRRTRAAQRRLDHPSAAA